MPQIRICSQYTNDVVYSFDLIHGVNAKNSDEAHWMPSKILDITTGSSRFSCAGTTARTRRCRSGMHKDRKVPAREDPKVLAHKLLVSMSQRSPREALDDLPQLARLCLCPGHQKQADSVVDRWTAVIESHASILDREDSRQNRWLFGHRGNNSSASPQLTYAEIITELDALPIRQEILRSMLQDTHISKDRSARTSSFQNTAYLVNQTQLSESEFSKHRQDFHEADSDFDQSFDDDDYLINPESHYEKLGKLEKMVVESSEFYQSNGAYEPSICHIKREDDLFTSVHCKLEVWKCLDKILPLSRTTSMLQSTTDNPICVGLSLGKSYLILCHILDILENLRQKGFCGNFFTILIQREPGNIAEMVQIEREAIVDFHEGIANAIVRILKVGRSLAVHVVSSALLGVIMPACERLMKSLGISLERSLPLYDILVLCRILTLLLDIGLVSYMGSHGSRFDIEYMAQDQSAFLMASDSESTDIGFRFALKTLACLDEFLNNQKVWTCQPLWAEPEVSEAVNRPLSILTSIEAFADTWGPIWEVSAGEDYPNHIRQLNVSTGFICRAEDEMKCPVEDAVPCHWFKSSALIPLPLSQNHDNTLIRRSQKLLISGLRSWALGINDACSYKLDDLERHYGLQMAPLGTVASSWAFDERQVGFSAAQYVGITVLGTQKKLPCTTQKQAIWNKWTNQPTRANPRLLNSYLGVEISHCTGNARRVKLRDIFTMKPIQALIDRQFPDLLSMEFGMSLQAAFESDRDSAIEDVWVTYHKFREQIAELVCCVFEILGKTGSSAGRFNAAFLNQNRELSMPVDLHLNSWAGFLKDSHLTAVYAIVNGNCLDSGELGYFVATCDSAASKPLSFTVLETQISIPHAGSSRDKIWLDQRGCLQRDSRMGADERIQVLTWDLGKVSELRGKLGRLLGSKQSQSVSREVQDRDELGGQHVSVLVRSTTPSFGGLSVRRTTPAKRVIEQEVKPLPDSLPIRTTIDKSELVVIRVL